ncbi:hypothetical protein [Flavobacterium sp. HNIBRBA15423]|uniref:hypothetical protein n=1 Tax=Flavobacterium sp. HNIBRBA15423 TaxID=3458683 RepID=UPI0040445108
MKIKPILFSTEMVQAILEGRKTQTRRTKGLETISKNANSYRYDGLDESGDTGTEYQHFFEIIDHNKKPIEKYCSIKSPYKIGDILWVREFFVKFEKWKELEQKFSYYYKADFYNHTFKYEPSIHMPKEACRLFLKIKNIRAERLNDISQADAIAEGIKKDLGWKNYLFEGAETDPYSSFETLWKKINGKESWNSNPWVWVIDFERCEKPKNFCDA